MVQVCREWRKWCSSQHWQYFSHANRLILHTSRPVLAFCQRFALTYRSAIRHSTCAYVWVRTDSGCAFCTQQDCNSKPEIWMCCVANASASARIGWNSSEANFSSTSSPREGAGSAVNWVGQSIAVPRTQHANTLHPAQPAQLGDRLLPRPCGVQHLACAGMLSLHS